MRIVIVGGGIMGCATALELARRGVEDVLLLERAVPGAEASSAAAGMLAAQIESKDDDELRQFVAARDGFAAWAEELRERTGIDVGYRRAGALVVARDDAELEALAATVRRQRAFGLDAEILRGPELTALEPGVSPRFLGGASFPAEAEVDPPQLLRALVAAVARTRATVRSGATVTRLVVEDGRARGVALEDQETIPADAVVLAAGSWSSLVPGIPDSLPRVEPVRGQLVMLEERPPKLRTILFHGHAYVVPRGDGRVICGSTTEHVGFRREITAGGVHRILGGALDLAPALAQAELVRTWCNFRPQVRGRRAPLVGASPLPGLFLATGHYRNGILLSKTTAGAVADAALASAPRRDA
jgi:glycine oxidase